MDKPPDDREWVKGPFVPRYGVWETRLVGDTLWHLYLGPAEIIFGPEDYAEGDGVVSAETSPGGC